MNGPMTTDYSAFVAACRSDGIVVERAIARTYQTLLAGAAPFAAIDGGAEKGFHTYHLSAIEACRRVYAVEANPETFAHHTSQQILKPYGPKVVPVHAALQVDPALTSIAFRASPSHPGRSGIDPVYLGNSEVMYGEPISVPATTIDQIAATAPLPIRFIKLDLEGGEYPALRGATSVLNTHRPTVVFENGSKSLARVGATEADFADFVKRAGYVIMGFDGEELSVQTLYRFWYAWLAPVGEQVPLRRAVTAAIAKKAA